MELITVPMLESGPDMDLVEKLVNDEAVKGMWCVPKYSNPDGITYSDETIARLASMKTAAPDFTLVWDNAYCVHEFEGDFVPFANMLEICEKAGNPDRVFEFASTSKITFPGAGVACFACSETNMAYMKKLLAAQVISFDKLNQLRHVLYFKNAAGVLAHMKTCRDFETQIRYRQQMPRGRTCSARHCVLAQAHGRLFRESFCSARLCKARA